MTILFLLLAISAILLIYALTQFVLNERRAQFSNRLDRVIIAKTNFDTPLTPEEIREMHCTRWAGD